MQGCQLQLVKCKHCYISGIVCKHFYWFRAVKATAASLLWAKRKRYNFFVVCSTSVCWIAHKAWLMSSCVRTKRKQEKNTATEETRTRTEIQFMGISELQTLKFMWWKTGLRWFRVSNNIGIAQCLKRESDEKALSLNSYPIPQFWALGKYWNDRIVTPKLISLKRLWALPDRLKKL